MLFNFESIHPQNSASVVANLWTAACGPDLAISPRFAEYNMRPTTGALQAGQLALQGSQPVGFVLTSAVIDNPALQAGWIDAIAVLPDCQKQGIGNALLAWAEEWLAHQKCARFRLGGSLRPFTPGLPSELDSEPFFRNKGYNGQPGLAGKFDWDVARDLSTLEISDSKFQIPNLTIEPGRPGQEDALLGFLKREFPGRWLFEFTEFLREQGRLSDYMLLWTENGVDGFARLTLEDSERPIERFYMHRLPRPWGQVGPLGVSQACRGKGYGAALIDAALRHLRHTGIRGCVIDWTSLVDFYAKFGFAPYRKYAMLTKKATSNQ